MKKFSHFEDDDGKRYSESKIDGYNFGDRLLEGVEFIIKIKDGDLVVSVDKEDKEYLSDLNEKRWLGAAKAYALENDVFEGPNGKELCLMTIDGKLNYEDTEQPKPTPIKIQKFSDILGGLK
mgnify:CR=1 FL=1